METKIIELIAEYLGKKTKEVKLEMDLIDDLNINSYDVMSIIGKFEDVFNIEVPDEDIRHLKKVKDIVQYIEEKSNSISVKN